MRYTIQASEPIDIMQLAKPEIDMANIKNKLVKNFSLLVEAGKTRDEIDEVIKSLKLPLNVHLWLTGHFSDLCGTPRIK